MGLYRFVWAFVLRVSYRIRCRAKYKRWTYDPESLFGLRLICSVIYSNGWHNLTFSAIVYGMIKLIEHWAR